jgi:hypothetical protein
MTRDTRPSGRERAQRIAVIGGFDRQAPLLSELAGRTGRTVEFHTGNVRGRGAHDLRAVIARSDLVVIVTDHNSHGGVQVAKRMARQLGRISVVLSRCGIARFGALLDALATRDRRAAS